MIRRGISSFLKTFNGISSRAIFTSPQVLQEADDAVNVGKDEFLKQWDERVVSALKHPNFSSDWTEKETTEEPKTTEIPKKLKLNFYMPSEIIMEEKEVENEPMRLLEEICSG